MRHLRLFALLPALVLLGGCNAVVLNPSGDVAAQQRDLLVQSTILMLLIIVPVMVTVVIFAWRYRQSNKAARYEPEWDHSTHLELLIWATPLVIIICLGALTWLGTHLLDPYRELGRISGAKANATDTKPLEIQVVSLDWKWLFIYPQYGIASVNEAAAPVDRPIEFRLTSSSVMNSFYIPALAGQIYTMPGMETQLHAVINEAGDYQGISANYSGAGFSGMHFAFRGLTDGDFDKWVAAAKGAQAGTLDRNTYLSLERPSENVPVTHYASVDPKLYNAILEMCVAPSKMCSSQIAAIDGKGGLGLAGTHNVTTVADGRLAPLAPGRPAPDRTYVATLCTSADGGFGKTHPAIPVPAELQPLAGAGLSPPGSAPPTLRSASLSAPPADRS